MGIVQQKCQSFK